MLNLDLSDPLIVNLDYRKDRWRECQAEFKRIGLKPQRVSAVSSDDISDEEGLLVISKSQHVARRDIGWPPPKKSIKHFKAALGCTDSHIKALSLSLETSGAVMVCEDDVTFHPDFVNKMNQFIERIPPLWDILIPGSNVIKPAKKLSSAVWIPVFNNGSHCYIVSERAKSRLLSLFKKGRLTSPVDILLNVFFVDARAYMPSTQLALQRHSRSDVGHVSNPHSELIKENFFP